MNDQTTLHDHLRRRSLAGWSLAWLLALGGVAAGCGNYSNLDVDFQLAVPAREDLAVELPTQSLVVADAAEYYVITRQVIQVQNGIVDALTGLVDHVRAFPPSQRLPDGRVWGPFPVKEDPSFEARLTIFRRPLPTGPGFFFDYRIEFHRRTDPPEAWFDLIGGRFDPGAGVRRGRGTIDVDLRPARLQGYPIRDWGELQTLKLTYQRLEYPHAVEMIVVNVPEAMNPGSSSSHAQNADGSGEMAFIGRARDNVLVQAISVRTRWLASGAGRGDARVIEGLAALGGVIGTDCWGPDTRPTYSRRDYDPRREEGSADSCAFPPP